MAEFDVVFSGATVAAAIAAANAVTVIFTFTTASQ